MPNLLLLLNPTLPALFHRSAQIGKTAAHSLGINRKITCEIIWDTTGGSLTHWENAAFARRTPQTVI
jgi:hypothetical protein